MVCHDDGTITKSLLLEEKLKGDIHQFFHSSFKCSHTLSTRISTHTHHTCICRTELMEKVISTKRENKWKRATSNSSNVNTDRDRKTERKRGRSFGWLVTCFPMYDYWICPQVFSCVSIVRNFYPITSRNLPSRSHLRHNSIYSLLSASTSNMSLSSSYVHVRSILRSLFKPTTKHLTMMMMTTMLWLASTHTHAASQQLQENSIEANTEQHRVAQYK